MTNEENINKNEPVNDNNSQDEEKSVPQQVDTHKSSEIDLSFISDSTQVKLEHEQESAYNVKTALLITTDSLKPPEAKPQSPDDIRVAVDTKVMSRTNIRRAREGLELDQQGQNSDLAIKHEVVIVVRGMVERLHMEEDKIYILGRTDLKSRSMPDIDLTPYGALDRGVSREHATIHLKDKHIYVTDLESTNGTFVAGEKLAPHQPQILHRGDSLELGRLAVQVMFR